jgi:hypothetical protein
MALSHTYNPAKPFATLMKGRPDETDSWQQIAVYSRQEYQEYRAKGWKPTNEFMASVDRARVRDH